MSALSYIYTYITLGLFTNLASMADRRPIYKYVMLPVYTRFIQSGFQTHSKFHPNPIRRDWFPNTLLCSQKLLFTKWNSFDCPEVLCLHFSQLPLIDSYASTSCIICHMVRIKWFDITPFIVDVQNLECYLSFFFHCTILILLLLSWQHICFVRPKLFRHIEYCWVIR